MSSFGCPKCQHDTIVKDSRAAKRSAGIRRRRACLSCDYRFSTYEVVADNARHDRMMANITALARDISLLKGIV